MFNYTKIGVTIGPASESAEVLRSLFSAGADFVRLNFSHGTHQSHAAAMAAVRSLEQERGEPIPVLQDLSGPRIRVGLLPAAGVDVAPGEIITFSTTVPEYQAGEIPLDAPGIISALKAGERLLVDDGRVEVKVVRLSPGKIFAEVFVGGTVTSHKGVNFPDSLLKLPALSAKDRLDLRFSVSHGVDAVGLSFVQSAQDILDARFALEELRRELLRPPLPPPPFIIAKIERHEAVRNLKEILEAADGLMVARGDLGLELPAPEVPLWQKRIIDAANAAAKPVIVATQLLDSMTEHPRPTRAEVSDVANAVIDHADALLLTNETAVGKYPVEAVAAMAEIIAATEKSHYDDAPPPAPTKKITATSVAITELSRVLSDEVHAKLILAASISGETGRLLSHVRPELPILVATETTAVWRQLNFSWGVKPFVMLPCNSIEELVERSVLYIKQKKLAKLGDKIIVVAGEPVGTAGNVNLVEVREVK